MRVMLLVKCEYCSGEAYIYRGERTDEDGTKTPIYLRCQMCKGNGEIEKPITLREFQRLLDKASCMEPDNAELGNQKLYTQCQDSRDAAGI